MDLETLKSILEMGWPALVTVAIFLLARQYMQTVESEITYLRDRITRLETELIEVKGKLLDDHLSARE